ncbi:MAG: MFS transporter [Patescibacteria group bacterium]
MVATARRKKTVILGLLGAVGFLTAYGAHAIAIGLPSYGRRYGLGYGAVGLLLAAYNLAEIVVKPAAGRLADRIGARPVMLWGTAFFSLSCLAYLFTPPAALPALRICQGLGAGALSVASMLLVARIFPERLGAAMGAYHALKGLGYAGVPLFGGVFGGGLRRLFAFAGVAGLGVFIMQAACSPLLAARGQAGLARPPRRHGRLWPWYLANFADMALLGIVLGFLPVRADALGYGPRAIGWLLLLPTLAYLLSQPPAGALADRIGRQCLVPASLAVGAAAVATLGRLSGWPLHAAAVAAGLALGATWANSLAGVGEAAGSGEMGSRLGLAGSCKDLGDVVGPLGLGILAQKAGLASAFSLCGLLGCLAAAVMILAGIRPGSRRPGMAGRADAKG